MALTEIKVSDKCCHLLEKDGERREGGKVITATAFEDRIMLFSDLIKDNISQPYNDHFLKCQNED